MKIPHINMGDYMALDENSKLDAIYNFLLSEFTPLNDVKVPDPPHDPLMDAIKMAREAAGMDSAQKAVAAHDQIQVGDTVILKSGGPVMIVTRLRKENDSSTAAIVSWFRDGKFWELPLPSLDMVIKHAVIFPSESTLIKDQAMADPHS